MKADGHVLAYCDTSAWPSAIFEVRIDDAVVVSYQETVDGLKIDRLIGYIAFGLSMAGGIYLMFVRRGNLRS